jgi:hypothetical protein
MGGAIGASGRAGGFVAAELRRRAWTPVLIGRDAEKLRAHPGSEVRRATLDDPSGLDRALRGVRAVINCAGPFLDTAAPVIRAALRARIHYLDVTAEQAAALATFDDFSGPANDAGITIVPAAAFYGGLGDLLATAAMEGWAAADEIRVAIALDSWKPTPGTRLTGKRNTFRRFVISSNKKELLPDPLPVGTWTFPPPFGARDVVAVPFSEIVTMSRHLASPEIHSVINLTPLSDLRDPDTPPPTASDETGRSPQVFLIEVVARRGGQERRAVARGRDIYAVTAPIVVEAVERILGGRTRRTGASAAGELFDARDFLRALTPEHLTTEFHW